MAKVTIKAGEDYALKLSKLGNASDEIAKKAIYAGAKIVADRMRAELTHAIGQTEDSKSSGDLIGSLGISPIKQDDKGDWNTKIGFDGYDSRGVPNQLKARVLESGSSKQKKRPFVRPAINATRSQVQEKMAQVIDEEISKLEV